MFGGFAIVAGFTGFFLPETNKKQLPLISEMTSKKKEKYSADNKAYVTDQV